MKIEKKYHYLKNRWLFLMLLLPVSFVIWYITETIFMTAGIWSMCWLDEIDNLVHCNWEWTLAYAIAKIIEKLLEILIYTWVVWFIPWIVMYIIWRKNLKKNKKS